MNGIVTEKSFTSSIRRVRLASESKKFAEYEVACSLRQDVLLEKQQVLKWSVWRRYSDFERLEATLRNSLGWHMTDKPLPSKHTFVLDKLAPEFLEQRRSELDAWWQQIISIDRATDFHRHHCDPHLKSFVQALNNSIMEDNSPAKTESISSKPNGGGSRRGRPTSLLRARNASLKKQSSISNNNSTVAPPSTEITNNTAPSSPLLNIGTSSITDQANKDTSASSPHIEQNKQPDSSLRQPHTDPQRAALLGQISTLRVSI